MMADFFKRLFGMKPRASQGSGSDDDNRPRKRPKPEAYEDADMTQFLQELLDAEVDAGNFLTLPTTFFPDVGRGCRRSTMFTQERFGQLYDCLFSAYCPSAEVTGRGGIGKTLWAYYAIRRTFTDNPNAVIFLESKDRPSICFRLHKRKVQRIKLDDYRGELNLHSTRRFAIGMAPSRVWGRCKIIMVTTVGQAATDQSAKEFAENQARTFVMPPPSQDEIRTVYQKLFVPYITAERFDKLLKLYGSTYQHVLDMPTMQTEEHDFDAARRAAETCSLEKMQDFLFPCLHPWHGDILLQPLSGQGYSFAGIGFASEQMLKICVATAFKHHQSINRLMAYASVGTSTAAVEDSAYELAAHETLASGGTFPVDAVGGQTPIQASGPGLTVDTAGNAMFHVSERDVFETDQLKHQVETWQQHSGASALYLVLAAYECPIISSILLPNVMLQMTTESSCTVPWQQLTRILDCLPESSVYHFMYVVPNKESFQVHGMDQQPKDGRASKVQVFKLEYDNAYKLHASSEPESEID